MKNQKGQFFSLDFIIAMAIAVLALGMLLHFYELNTYEQQNARTQNELTLIAMNSSNILLNTNNCTAQTSLKNKGYEMHGCTDTSSWGTLTKADLMIPDEFNCYITKGGSPAINGCVDVLLANTPNIAVIERNFLERNLNILKSAYELCLDGGSCTLYTPAKLMVKIWK